MLSSISHADYCDIDPELEPIATHGGIVMQNGDFPGSLSPCVRIFLEILRDEAFSSAPAESLAPFEQALAQTEQLNCATESK
jgi:hypothetical protein